MKNMKEIIKNYNQINSKRIINRGGIVHDFYHLKWYQKWLIISDYWYAIKEGRGFSKNITEIIDYYLWLLDLSIFCVKDYDKFVSEGIPSHLFYDISDLNNPLYMVIDIKERDLGEFIKYLFWSNQYQDFDFRFFLNKNYDYNYDLVLSRIIYPNYFFDKIYDSFVRKEEICDIKDVVDRQKEFELFLHHLISVLIENKKIKNSFLAKLFRD